MFLSCQVMNNYVINNSIEIYQFVFISKRLIKDTLKAYD